MRLPIAVKFLFRPFSITGDEGGSPSSSPPPASCAQQQPPSQPPTKANTNGIVITNNANANGNAIDNANANANAYANGNFNTNAITNGNANINGIVGKSSSPLSSAHEDSAASISIARRHLPTRKNVAKKKRNLRESLPPLPPADVWQPHDIPTAEEAIASVVRRSERNKGKPLRNYNDMESDSDYEHPSSSSNQKSKSTSGSKTKSVRKAKHKQPKSSSGSKANPVKKSKRNQRNVPQDVITDIQLNALDNTRVAENNLPETKLVIPRHTDVKLADIKQKSKREGVMVLHEKRFGYSIIPNDENYAKNRCLEQITRYENHRDYSAYDEYETGVIQSKDYGSTYYYVCFGVR
jgi:hypothetical protein